MYLRKISVSMVVVLALFRRERERADGDDGNDIWSVLRRAADALVARVRLEDRRRRQPQRERRGLLPEEGRDHVEERPAAPASAARAVNGGRPPTDNPHAVQLHRPQHVRRQHPQSRARHRVRVPLRPVRSRRREARREDRHRAHAQGAEAGRGRAAITSIPSAGKARSRNPPSPDSWPPTMGSSHSDYENAFPPRVKPGDIILVHAGVLQSDRFHYMNGAAASGLSGARTPCSTAPTS